jgi:cysteinyl-tRNA synthetase, unknown class
MVAPKLTAKCALSDRLNHARVEARLCGCLLVVLLMAACSARSESPTVVDQSESADLLGNVESWGYQLQSIDLDELRASGFDLVVIDAANDDGDSFSRDEIASLQASGKRVMAYLSIGEAETYRDYWRAEWVDGDACDAPLTEQAPSWLEIANPEWCGNYLVEFWDDAWQQIIFEILDSILEVGFDGVYLDKVDSFYTWLDEEPLGAPFANPQAAARMTDFVQRIAEHARADHPDFVIVPQNAVEIIEYVDAEQRAAYLAVINGIAVEDTFFYPSMSEDENAPYDPQEYVIDVLRAYQAEGLPIFAVDYVTEPALITQFYAAAHEQGYIPYAGGRALDRLVEQP